MKHLQYDFKTYIALRDPPTPGDGTVVANVVEAVRNDERNVVLAGELLSTVGTSIPGLGHGELGAVHY